jgi:predicted AAA+ superfamily ATPase
MLEPYKRQCTQILENSLQELGQSFMQILIGPRQVGKSFAARQIAKQWPGKVVHGIADELNPPSHVWIEEHWRQTRVAAKSQSGALLILDEIQKVPNWTEVVKGLWDRDSWEGQHFPVLLLGSSSMLLQKGLTESLAGRFMLHRALHWSWPEMRDAFGVDFEDWLLLGGYPGAMQLKHDPDLWTCFMRDSIIESVLSRDILQLQTVNKPALLRQLFGLACAHPAQMLSYNKMLGQMQDAGNTVTLSHYLRLLGSAFLVSGLEPFTEGGKPARAGSPKLIIWDNSLIHAALPQTPQEPAWRGRLVENAVGAHLLKHLPFADMQVRYWRKGDHEVDFVLSSGSRLVALEVKSGRARSRQGLNAFVKLWPKARLVVLGEGGLGLKEFFEGNPKDLLQT